MSSPLVGCSTLITSALRWPSVLAQLTLLDLSWKLVCVPRAVLGRFTYPRSPRICVQYGYSPSALFPNTSRRTKLTPASTLVISSTLIPFNGNAPSSAAAAAVVASVLLEAQALRILDFDAAAKAFRRQTTPRLANWDMIGDIGCYWACGRQREWARCDCYIPIPPRASPQSSVPTRG